MPISLVRDLRVMLRKGGLEAGRHALANRTVHRLYRRQRLLVLEHPLDGEPEPSSIPGVELRTLDEAQLEELVGAMPGPTVHRFRRRLAHGRSGIVGWRDGGPIGYGWVSGAVEPGVESLPLPLPRGAAYCWDLFVDPAERGNGVGSALAIARLRLAREHGFERAWRLVDPDNAPSLRTAARSGASVQVVGKGTVVTLMGRTRARYTFSGGASGEEAEAVSGGLREWLGGAIGERFVVRSLISPRASVWRLIHRSLLLPFVLTGEARLYRVGADGGDLRVLCVGEEQRFQELLSRLFPGPRALEARLGRSGTWAPRSLAANDADIVAVEIHPWLSERFRRAGWLLHPQLVRWVGSLDSIPPARPSRSLRSDLLKTTQGDYALEESSGSADDWAHFRDRMLRPYTERRFGDDAWHASPGLLRDLRRSGRLLFVTQADRRVAGVCVVQRGPVAWLALLGVAQGELSLMREGALAAAYSLVIDWAKRAGAARLDVGRTAGFDDTAAHYKRKWGLTPLRDPLSRLIALHVDEAHPLLSAALERERPFLEGADAMGRFGGPSEPPRDHAR